MSRVQVLLPVAPLADAVIRYARRRDQRVCDVFGCAEDWHATRHRLFRDALHAGQVPLELAEDICDETLGQHTRMHYGQAWDRAADQAAGGPPHTVSRRVGTRSGYTAGCRCLDCTAANTAYTRRHRTQQQGGEAA